jgi:hypothetical protein
MIGGLNNIKKLNKMLKKILKAGGAQKLSAKEQKSITGGAGVPPSNCKCFCYNSSGVKVSASCFKYCPDGTVPGLYPGSTGNCTFPLN